MADINKVQQEILNRITEKNKLKRKEKIDNIIKNVTNATKTPFNQIKKAVERKLERIATHKDWQNRQQQDYERFLSLYDENKFGTFETERQDFDTTLKTIIHTEIGPIIEWKHNSYLKGGGTQTRTIYEGIAPISENSNNYEYSKLWFYENRDSKGKCLVAWFSGITRDKKGHFNLVQADCELGESVSPAYKKLSTRFNLLKDRFNKEKEYAVPLKSDDCNEMGTDN